MANAKSNPILKWVALGVVAVGAIVFLKSGGDDNDRPQQYDMARDRQLQQELAALNIDGDSPKETIRTLVAHVKSQEEKSNEIMEMNKKLVRENQATDDKIDDQLKQRTAKLKSDIERDNQNLLSGLTGRLNTLTGMVNTNIASTTNLENTLGNQGDIPVGLGFDGISAGFDNTDNDGWILPMDLPKPNESGVIDLNRPGSHGTDSLFNDLTNTANQAVTELEKIAWYTVPENSTLMGSTAMTGMIGRIPINGRVIDPYPFKIIVSSYNLATNGHHIPGLNGMIFSGVATGDLMLKCVSAKLYSVTYTQLT
jgi:integrating conjugative element protein (TIGR03752 family)